MCERYAIDVPEYNYFGFYMIDAWTKKDRNKLAMIRVNLHEMECIPGCELNKYLNQK